MTTLESSLSLLFASNRLYEHRARTPLASFGGCGVRSHRAQSLSSSHLATVMREAPSDGPAPLPVPSRCYVISSFTCTFLEHMPGTEVIGFGTFPAFQGA